MQLQAVILPPPEVVDGALAAAQVLAVAPPEPAEPSPGGLKRLFKGSAKPVAPPELELVPIVTPAVRVVRFGNVTNDDAQALADAMETAAKAWSAMTLHVSGMLVERTSTQFLLEAELGGETDLAWTVFRGVNDVARLQRFFLDRRSFLPQFTVAGLKVDGEPNPSTFETVPEFALGSAETYTGPEWRATHVDLVRVPFAAGAALEVIRSVPFGGETP